MTDYAANNKQWKRRNLEFATMLPDTAQRFSALTQSIFIDGALNKKTKYLLAAIASLAAKCEHCATNHLVNALKLGATKAELAELVSILVAVQGGTGYQHNQVFEIFDAFQRGELT